MPYGIKVLGYLPLGKGENPAFSPAEASTRFSDPGGRGMQGMTFWWLGGCVGWE